MGWRSECLSLKGCAEPLNEQSMGTSLGKVWHTHGAHDFIRKILANLGWPTRVTISGKRAWLTSGNYRLLAHAEGSERWVRGGDSVKAQASQDKGVPVNSVFATKKRRADRSSLSTSNMTLPVPSLLSLRVLKSNEKVSRGRKSNRELELIITFGPSKKITVTYLPP